MSPHQQLDRDLFAPDAIDPATADFNAGVERVLTALPPINTLSPPEIRAQREAGEGPWGPVVRVEEARDRRVSGTAGEVPVRVLVPDEVRGVYLHIHGGGWTLGAPHHQDVPNQVIAQQCKLAVVSVDYRLAPEHPHPAGPDDCENAAVWLAKNAQSEFGSERLLIGGESAGAHLSVVTLLRLRDRHGFGGFSRANLTYGAYDLTMTPSVRRWGERNLILNTPIIGWFTDHFVPAERRLDPDVSPLYADLSGMPPALFTVGTLDPLLDDSLFMHARWLAAGSQAELAVHPGGIHGFNAFPTPLAKRANERILDFLSQDGAEER